MGAIKEYVPLWILFALPGALLVLAAYYIIKEKLAVKSLKRRHIEIEAKVTEIKPYPYLSDPRLKKPVWLVSEYTVNGNTYCGQNYTGGKDIYEGDYSVGDDIVIHVDPEEPQRFLLKEQDNDSAGSLAGGITAIAVGVLLIAFGIILLITGHGGPIGR